MKTLRNLWVVLLLVAFAMQAQDKQQDRTQLQLQEHFMFKDGKMYQVRDQEQIQLQTQLRLQSGLVVNPDGTYQLQNQNRLQLKNGECLDINGQKYNNQEHFRAQTQIRNQAMAQEHYMFQNGEMLQIKNQERVQLKEQLKLKNGTVINPDGSYQGKGGKRQQLKNGECLDPDGNKYQNQERFREHMEMQMKEKQQGMDKGKMQQGAQKKGKN